MFIAALPIRTKIWKQPKSLITRREDERAVVHLHNGRLLGHKKEGNLTFVTAQIDPENMILREISQSEKNKYYMVSLICGM